MAWKLLLTVKTIIFTKFLFFKEQKVNAKSLRLYFVVLSVFFNVQFQHSLCVDLM